MASIARMGLRQALLITALSISANAFAKVAVCELKLTSAPEKLARKIVNRAGYFEDRSLKEYRDSLPPEFDRALLTAQTWIDSGGGIGQAQKDAQALNLRINTVNITKTKGVRLGKIGRHENRPARALEDYGPNDFHSVDLITDFYGAFSYSPHPDLVLQRFNDWLQPEGSAFIHFRADDVVMIGTQKMTLMDWVSERSGFNCRLSGTVDLVCKPVPGIIGRMLELEQITEDGPPPRRVFREVAEHELEANIELEAQDDSGVYAGTFEAHLSPDQQVLRDVYFGISKRRQGYSRELSQALLEIYPRINRVHASLIRDNLEAFNAAKDQGLTDSDALKQTPFYKVFGPLGFSRIELHQVNRNGVDVILRK